MVLAEPPDAGVSAAILKEWQHAVADLWRAFEAEPVEDGMIHPAEQIVEEYAELLAGIAPRQLVSMLAEEGGEFAASALCCIGRCEIPRNGWPVDPPAVFSSKLAHHLSIAKPGGWRLGLVEAALDSPDVRIRDAAVQASENWEDPDVLPALQGHRDSVPWLSRYAQGVASDLSA